MSRHIWIYSQYLWPDGAPTGIYAEQLGEALHQRGHSVCLVGGQGAYRSSPRPEPAVPRFALPHYRGGRQGLWGKGREFYAVQEAFSRHIDQTVQKGDVVVMISAPPSTVHFHRRIHRRGATAVYWLQDYYPELLRGFCRYPGAMDRTVRKWWDRELAGWDQVVKAAGNLGYEGRNVTVIRNWPAQQMGGARPFVSKTALFSGNLGFAHHVPSFSALCLEMQAEGYEVMVRGDGRGMRHLPAGILRRPLLADPAALIRSYWETEVHLIAGHPDLPQAVFPSKFWNIRAVNRVMRASGFTGALRDEFEIARTVDYSLHLPAWCALMERFP